MLQTLITLALFLFPLAYSPGPGNMFFAANGARFGFRSTLPASIGYHVATWIVTVIVGFGFAAAIDQFQLIFFTLKVAGSAYLFWIAWKLFMAGVLKDDELARPATFFDGVILLILNPKAYLIISLMFTQFLDAFETGLVFAVLIIASVFTLNNFVAFSVWTVFGDQIAGLFRMPSSARRLNITFAILLAMVAIWLLLS